eukprot:XP_011666762.1 PREDICTED: plasmolipin-like [Strongylocentrotus purpuratus]
MAETGGFPDTHTTSTYSPTTTTQTASPRVRCTIDKGYATSLPSIIRIVEIIVGFMYWTVVSSYWFGCVNHSTGWYNWVIFVSVTTWVITVILFIFFLLSLTKQVTIINWMLTELINNAAACLLHFIAAIFISIKAGQPAGRYEHGKIIWGCMCGWTLVVLYGIGTFFNVREFQAMGGLGTLRLPGQAATTTTTTAA